MSLHSRKAVTPYSLLFSQRKRVMCMLHGPGMLSSKAPVSKQHLYSRYIMLHCWWLECAKAAWPNWQPASQALCLHPACCLFPGQHGERLAEQPNALFRAGSRPPGSAGWIRGSRWEEAAVSWRGRNNPWLPVGWEAYLRRGKVGVGCCCPGLVGKAGACVGRVKTGRCC